MYLPINLFGQNYSLSYDGVLSLYNSGLYVKAFQKAESLAMQGYAPAQGLLGYWYLTGVGVSPNIEKALLWTKKAADQGDVDSCCELGVYYYEGLGVEKNIDLAKKYFLYAANNKSDHAMYSLGVIAREEGKSEFIQAQWYTKALQVNPNNIGALFNLGDLLSGNGLYKDAYNIFLRGANLGDAKCQYQIAVYYCFKPDAVDWPVKKDLKKAKYWAKKASDQGHLRASKLIIDIDNGEL